ncbi:metal-dependent hydrolase [Candidatus Woesearchaeota archaeon]|nr:metal-dependent hydrolase [Candidatus Woesearchaeota archaeon]
MKFYTHMAFSLVLYSIVAYTQFIQFESWHIPLLLFSSILPDIDAKKSLIGRFFSFLELEHRGFFHSVWFMAFATMVAYIISQTAAKILIIGIGSHLLIDQLNHKGLRPLYPIPFRIKGIVKSGYLADKLIFILCLSYLICFFFLR